MVVDNSKDDDSTRMSDEKKMERIRREMITTSNTPRTTTTINSIGGPLPFGRFNSPRRVARGRLRDDAPTSGAIFFLLLLMILYCVARHGHIEQNEEGQIIFKRSKYVFKIHA
jgi:hypothetical protein